MASVDKCWQMVTGGDMQWQMGIIGGERGEVVASDDVVAGGCKW